MMMMFAVGSCVLEHALSSIVCISTPAQCIEDDECDDDNDDDDSHQHTESERGHCTLMSQRMRSEKQVAPSRGTNWGDKLGGQNRIKGLGTIRLTGHRISERCVYTEQIDGRG